MREHLGELYGLLTALCWAAGGILFHRVALPAQAINLGKNLIAGAILALFFAVVVATSDATLRASPEALAWLCSSSLVGIVIGDSCYFRCMQILGPRRAMLLQTLAPPIGAALGLFVLGERLSPLALLGIAVTLSGVAWVIHERPRSHEGSSSHPGRPRAGVLFGVLAAAGQAVGAAWSKVGIQHLERLGSASASLEAAAWRIWFAALACVLLALVRGRLGTWTRAAVAGRALYPLVPAATVGCLLGIWLSMLAFQHAPIGVATTLTAMSPVLVLPMVRVFLGQSISPRAAIGAAIAVLGVAVVATR